MSYEKREHRIESGKCELNVVHHCNLSCRGCSHLSPRAKKFFVSPEKVFKDFSILAKFYHLKCMSLLGGEPLLHPDLLAVVDAVRQSGVSESIRVVTNGVLLWKMPDLFWQSVDQVHISLYPGHGMSVQTLRVYQRRARQHGVDLELRHVDCFREPYSELGTNDLQLIGRIYKTCKTAHLWRCHTVCEGYIFRCPQSVFIGSILGGAQNNGARDGLRIVDRTTFSDDLLAFLVSRRPLDSCRYCLGSVGRRFTPVQESRLIARRPRSTEALVDWEYLNNIERLSDLKILSLLQVASIMARKTMARMPSAIRLHPGIFLWKAAARKILPILK
jgi:cyclic pyranopterin phosphate synthase